MSILQKILPFHPKPPFSSPPSTLTHPCLYNSDTGPYRLIRGILSSTVINTRNPHSRPSCRLYPISGHLLKTVPLSWHRLSPLNHHPRLSEMVSLDSHRPIMVRLLPSPVTQSDWIIPLGRPGAYLISCRALGILSASLPPAARPPRWQPLTAQAVSPVATPAFNTMSNFTRPSTDV